MKKNMIYIVAGTVIGLGGMLLSRRRREMWAIQWNRHSRSVPHRVALVTGASSGIGEAYASRLASMGYDLILVARREERLQDLASKVIEGYHVRGEVLAADLSTNKGIHRVEQRILERSDVDFLVHAAGYDEFGLFKDIPIEKTLGLINCLLLASVRLCRAALPGMLERRFGAIVNVSSIGAFTPKSHDSTYVASKAYLNMFTETLAIELIGTGIRVQTLCPGFTLSEFHDDPQYAKYRLKERIPRWLWMTSEEVVEGSLRALAENRVVCVPGLKNQIIVAISRTGLTSLLMSYLRKLLQRRE
jgi:short-subunit dehydrogenase